MEEFKKMGLGIALDDFGTGYSSLSRLRGMPIDELKIDQSFIRELIAVGEGSAIVSLIIDLAHTLGQKVVAEGVETEEQLKILIDLGCDEIQGFLFSPALSSGDFASLLRRDRRLDLPRSTVGAKAAGRKSGR